jgi:hypothetical protein
MNAKRYICALLVPLLACLPMDEVRANLIPTPSAVAADAQSGRAAILTFLARPEAARQLQALGVEQRVVEQRIAAMSDDEARELAANAGLLPAAGQYGGGGGGGGGGGSALAVVLVILLLVFLLVWWNQRRSSSD